MLATRRFRYRFAHRYCAQMIELGWKRSGVAADLLRSDPYGAVTGPAPAKNVFGKMCQKVSSQIRLLQSEGVVGARQNHHRAVGDMYAQRILQLARREKIELTGHDHRRCFDRR